jgi:type I restriction enzyme S subunit
MEPKEGWEEKKLGDVAEVNRGRSKHRPRNDKRLFGGPYPFIQTGDIRNAQGGEIKDFSQTYSEFGLSQSKLWEKGTICITIAANIGETAILGFDACFPDSIVGIHPDETVLDALFLNYYLLSIKKDIDSQSYGTAQKNINLEVLNNIVMRIPPLDVQQRIVERLDSLSENVRKYEEIQRQIISECDALKQALLRKVFE